MSKNRKKIIGTLLGIMASVSSAGAMQNAPNTGSANTETFAKSTKRNQNTTSIYWNIAKLFVSGLAANEIASSLPFAKNLTYPLFRRLSGYRVRYGVRGEFHRSINPSIRINNNYKILNEKDNGFYNLNFGCFLAYYDIKNDIKNDVKMMLKNGIVLKDRLRKINNANVIGKINPKKNLVIKLVCGVPTINLSMESDDGTVLNKEIPNFLRSGDDFSVDDAADALSKAIELTDLINSNKSDEDKLKLINKKFNVLCSPGEAGGISEKASSFRILVKERKNSKGELRKIYAEFQLIAKDKIEPSKE